ncbi:unnamed protein product, partial [Polarella glacialis]
MGTARPGPCGARSPLEAPLDAALLTTWVRTRAQKERCQQQQQHQQQHQQPQQQLRRQVWRSALCNCSGGGGSAGKLLEIGQPRPRCLGNRGLALLEIRAQEERASSGVQRSSAPGGGGGDALRVLHRLLRRKGLCIPEAEFNNVAEALVQRAVLLRCPTEDLLEAELQAAGMFSGGSLGAAALARSNEEQMARLVKELLPQWLAGGTADGASERRLRLAADCWERCGPRGDLDGFELREVSRAAPYIQEVRTSGVDLRLAYQPSFLEDLVEYGLVTADAVSQGSDSCGLPALAAVARQGELLGVARRRHGALLLRRGDGTAGNTKYEVLATGFNHAATPLGPKGVDQRTGKVRTFPSLSEAAAGGLNLQSRKIRPAQRHAEVHCLLQLPRLKHDALGTEILIVEIADVGPSLGWAEPCSRGCLQLLLKMGVSKAHFTDGQGCLVERHLTHTPDLDVPYKTFARRTSDCVISERAWLDIQEKLRQ